MIEGNIADGMCLDSNGVINLLEEYVDIDRQMRSFDFDDSASLDNDAYYDATGFTEGKAFPCLLRFPWTRIFRSFRQLVDAIIVIERLACSVSLCFAAIFLLKTRLDLSSTVLESMFYLNGKSQLTGDVCAVRLVLSKTVVLRYRGF